MDYVPTTLCQRYNDATDYWMQTRAFATAGFDSGYFGREEDISRCPGIRFGWQNFISYAYGLPAYVLGWELWSSAVWNPVLIGACLFFFLRAIRTGRKRLITVGLLTATFWPLLFFLPTMMAEPFHYCIAVLAAAGFARALSSGGNVRKRYTLATVALLFLAAVARPSWLPLLFLSVFLAYETMRPKQYLLAAGGGMVLCGLSYTVFSLMMPDTSTYSAAGALMAGTAHIRTITTNLIQNILLLAKGPDFLIAFRIQTGVLLAGSAVALIMALKGHTHERRNGVLSPFPLDAFIHFFNLASIVFLTVAAYTTDNWGDYRILSIHVLFSALLAAARWKITAIPVFLVVGNILLAPMFINEYRLYRGLEFTYDNSRLSAFYSRIRPHIQYTPGADPWDNTLLYGGLVNFFPTELIALPAGFGLRIIVVPQNLRFPVHSRYILLDNSYYLDWIAQKERLFFLTKTTTGDLYYCLHENESPFAEDGRLKGDPDNPDLSCWLGDAYMEWDRTDDAIPYYRRALAHAPGMYHALFNLGLCYGKKGDDEASGMYFEKAIERNPDRPEPYYNIACIHARSGRTDEAIAWLRKSIEKGYCNWPLLRTDGDLDNIRGTAFYELLLRDADDKQGP
ncbi:MAG: tetratricopeptide repeat protein [Thermodesulfobacteriota bacterium]